MRDSFISISRLISLQLKETKLDVCTVVTSIDQDLISSTVLASCIVVALFLNIEIAGFQISTYRVCSDIQSN